MKFIKYVQLREEVGNVIPQNIKNHVNHRLQVLLTGTGQTSLPINDIRKVLFASGVEIDEESAKNYHSDSNTQRVMPLKYNGEMSKSSLIVSMPFSPDSVRIN